MGSVAKRGSTYYIRYEGPPHADGKRNQKKEACPGMNKRQAEDLLRKRETEVRNGSYRDTSDITMAEWFEQWITRKEKSLSPTTVEGYRNKWRLNICPIIGHIAVQRIRTLTIQKLLDSYSDSLSPKSIHNISGIIHSCLSDAVTLGLISSNPADNLILPKKCKPAIELPEQGDLEKMINELQGTAFYMPFILITGTGMRRGEVLGLKWSDFNQKSKTIAICRSIVQIPDAITVKTPKTDKVRVILLPDHLIEELLKHKAEQISHGHNTEWIMTNSAGYRLTPNALSRGIMDAMRRTGVKASLHSWRHDQATKLLLAGIPAKVVSERLGHSTVSITQDIYAHVLPQMQKDAVDFLNAEWQSKLNGSKPKNEESTLDNF